MKKHFLEIFLYPKSVAVVGATNNINTLNYNLFANLVNLNFPGRIYPVNPRSRDIMGIPAYPDVRSIKNEVDIVVTAVPAARTIDVVKDCIAKKVKGIVLISGGFSETGDSGNSLQTEIKQLLRENGIRALGPNTLGPINTANNFAVSFRAIEKLPPGKVSLIFQSGLYDPRINWLTSEFNLYINKLIDLGNKMDINETDALEYLAGDPGTKVIAMHLENIAGDGRKFLQILKNTCREKPVIILKSARTQAGVKAAMSHTGSIVRASDAVFDTVIKQSGAIRAQTIDDLFDLAKIFEYLFPVRGNRVHVSTGPGGEGVLATDLCYFNGLEIARLSPKSLAKLRTIFPPWDISPNPFDIGVCSQFNDITRVYQTLLGVLAEDPNVDNVALMARVDRFKDPEQFLELALDTVRRGKPFVVWMTVMPQGGNTIVHRLESHRIPVFPSAERAIKALAALYRYGKWQENIQSRR